MKKKPAYLLSFVFSLIFYLIIFYPQIGYEPAYYVLGFFYGYIFLLPISLLIIFFNPTHPYFEKFNSRKGIYMGLFAFVIIMTVVSWLDKYQNDFLINCFWAATLIVWLGAYYRLVKENI